MTLKQWHSNDRKSKINTRTWVNFFLNWQSGNMLLLGLLMLAVHLGSNGHDTIRYDTIRDAILTCARKPTWVSLIYRTQPTTTKCKNRKTKSRKQTCSEITVNSPGNPCSEYSRRRNEGLQWVGFAEKEGFKRGVKEWVGGHQIIVSITVGR